MMTGWRTIGLVAALLGSTAAQAADPVVVLRADEESVSLATGDFVSLTPEGTQAFAQLKLIEHPGYRTPLHVHKQTDETFYVLEGALTLFVDGKLRTLGPGDYAFIPRGTPHAQGNVTDSKAVVLLSLAPGEFSAFFKARADLVKTTPPDHPDYGPRMRALGRDHDITIVGPPPF
jgi:quercetin dioxygenase-like cupin family protein